MKNTTLSAFLISAIGTHALPVQAWVPDYGVEQAKAGLEKSYDGIKASSVLTHLALQYWNVRDTGGAYNRNSDADVEWFVNYGKANGIRVLLTVVNAGPGLDGKIGFDWFLTRKACYGANAAKTIKELLSEMDRYQLDGIDLDIEGEDGDGGPFTTDDRQQYALFVNTLADSVHARGKVLHISTYPTNGYGAPKVSWWADWAGKIDAINPMGYDYTGKNGTGSAAYPYNQNIALGDGYQQDQFMSGLPVWLDTWKGISAVDHVSWIADSMPKPSGIALWDIHHLESEGTWTDPKIWQALQKIKAMPKGFQNSSSSQIDTSKGMWIDQMKGPGANLQGGVWYAGTDYWSRSTALRSNSSKAWTLDKSYEMSLGEGTWGKIENGYDLTNSPAKLGTTFEILGPVDPNSSSPWAAAYLQMEFLPRDCDKSPDACWEIAKTGVEADYSNYKQLIVGLRCTQGKTLKLSYTSVSNMNGSTPLASFACSGDWQNQAINLDPILAKKMFRMNLEWKTTGQPETMNVEVAGVALDKTVINGVVVANRASKTNEIQIFNNTLILPAQTPFQVYNVTGQLLFKGTSQDKALELGGLGSGLYLVKTPQQSIFFTKH